MKGSGWFRNCLQNFGLRLTVFIMPVIHPVRDDESMFGQHKTIR